MPRLLVVRHPRVQVSGVCYGQSDPPCTVSSEELAELAVQLNREDLTQATLWSSPAQRCLLVSRHLTRALTLPLSIDVRLQELSMGSFEGLPYSQLEGMASFNHWMNHWTTQAPPRGESLQQLQARVSAWLEELVLERLHLVIAHAGIVRALRVLLDGMTWPAAMAQEVPYLSPVSFTLPRN